MHNSLKSLQHPSLAEIPCKSLNFDSNLNFGSKLNSDETKNQKKINNMKINSKKLSQCNILMDGTTHYYRLIYNSKLPDPRSYWTRNNVQHLNCEHGDSNLGGQREASTLATRLCLCLRQIYHH